jgi:hypothetical protein
MKIASCRKIVAEFHLFIATRKAVVLCWKRQSCLISPIQMHLGNNCPRLAIPFRQAKDSHAAVRLPGKE